jgi:hypothetical protein
MRQTTFGQAVRHALPAIREFRKITFSTPLPRRQSILLERRYERFPYVPSDAAGRDERCAEVYEIQVQGLASRLRATGLARVVIGISGGIDSTQALLVCAQALDRLGAPRSNLLAYTMPGFATSERTLAQARGLMASIGCTAHELDIRPAAGQMLKDIGHPYAEGRELYDVTFENVQAGERTNLLFRLANLNDAIVVGTGDLSELVHLRRGRSDVALRRQRERAEDLDSARDSVGRRYRSLRPRDQRRAPRNSRDRNQSRTGATQRRCDPGDRGIDRPLRTAGLQSLLHLAVRLSAAQDRLPRL